MHTLDFASSRSRNTSVASQQTPNQNQPFPMLRSILQAAARETHQWHRSKHQIKTSHSPCRRSILQAAAQETHQWHRSKHQINSSHSPCRRSIVQAGTQETTSDLSGIAAKTKTKPAILVYKHVRGSRLTRFSRIPNCTLDLGRLRAWTLQETNTADHHLGSLFPHVHTETQRPHNKASPEGLALPRTKRNDLSNLFGKPEPRRSPPKQRNKQFPKEGTTEPTTGAAQLNPLAPRLQVWRDALGSNGCRARGVCTGFPAV